MPNITSISQLIDSWLEDIDPNAAKPTYPFGLRVGCVKMAAPRHERFDFIRELGAELFEKVFSNTPIDLEHLVFVFPERHLSVHEQQAFTYVLSKHVSAKTFKVIDIITSSPLIIGGFARESIRILTWSDDEKHSGSIKHF